jgi:hypothetical protein
MNILTRSLLIGFILLPITAHAWVDCVGKFEKFHVIFDGRVQVYGNALYGNNTGRSVCDVSKVWKGVAPEACKSWVSILLTAQAAQQPIRIQYPDGISCRSMPTWGGAIAPQMIETNFHL